MVVELVVNESGKQVGSYMSASDDAVRPPGPEVSRDPERLCLFLSRSIGVTVFSTHRR